MQILVFIKFFEVTYFNLWFRNWVDDLTLCQGSCQDVVIKCWPAFYLVLLFAQLVLGHFRRTIALLENSHLGQYTPGQFPHRTITPRQFPPRAITPGQRFPGQFPSRTISPWEFAPWTFSPDSSYLGLLPCPRIITHRQLLPRAMAITSYNFCMAIFCFFSMVQLYNFCYDNKNNNDNSNKTWSLKLSSVIKVFSKKMVTTLQNKTVF